MKKKLVLFMMLVFGVILLASCSDGNTGDTTSAPSSVPTTDVPTIPTTTEPVVEPSTTVPTEVTPDPKELVEFRLTGVQFMFGSAFLTFNVINHTDKEVTGVSNYSFVAYNNLNEEIFVQEYLVCYFMELLPNGTTEHLVGIEDEEVVAYIKSVGSTYNTFEINFDAILYADDGNDSPIIIQTTTPTPSISNLEAPTIVFDDTNNVLSWNSISNAQSYTVSINGNETVVDETKLTVVIKDEITTFKVKANATDSELDSDWSSEIVYSVDSNNIYNYIKIFVNKELKEGTEFKGLVGAYVSQNISYNLFVIILQAETNDVEHIVRLAYKFDNKLINTISKAIQNNSSASETVYEEFDIVPFDVQSELIENDLDSFVGSQENNGYSVEVVKSFTTNYLIRSNGTYRYFVYTLYKSTDTFGDIVYYFSIHTITVSPSESDEDVYGNYLTSESTVISTSSYALSENNDCEDLGFKIEAEDKLLKDQK